MTNPSRKAQIPKVVPQQPEGNMPDPEKSADLSQRVVEDSKNKERALRYEVYKDKVDALFEGFGEMFDVYKEFAYEKLKACNIEDDFQIVYAKLKEHLGAMKELSKEVSSKAEFIWDIAVEKIAQADWYNKTTEVLSHWKEWISNATSSWDAFQKANKDFHKEDMKRTKAYYEKGKERFKEWLVKADLDDEFDIVIDGLRYTKERGKDVFGVTVTGVVAGVEKGKEVVGLDEEDTKNIEEAIENVEREAKAELERVQTRMRLKIARARLANPDYFGVLYVKVANKTSTPEENNQFATELRRIVGDEEESLKDYFDYLETSSGLSGYADRVEDYFRNKGEMGDDWEKLFGKNKKEFWEKMGGRTGTVGVAAMLAAFVGLSSKNGKLPAWHKEGGGTYSLYTALWAVVLGNVLITEVGSKKISGHLADGVVKIGKTAIGFGDFVSDFSSYAHNRWGVNTSQILNGKGFEKGHMPGVIPDFFGGESFVESSQNEMKNVRSLHWCLEQGVYPPQIAEIFKRYLDGGDFTAKDAQIAAKYVVELQQVGNMDPKRMNQYYKQELPTHVRRGFSETDRMQFVHAQGIETFRRLFEGNTDRDQRTGETFGEIFTRYEKGHTDGSEKGIPELVPVDWGNIQRKAQEAFNKGEAPEKVLNQEVWKLFGGEHSASVPHEFKRRMNDVVPKKGRRTYSGMILKAWGIGTALSFMGSVFVKLWKVIWGGFGHDKPKEWARQNDAKNDTKKSIVEKYAYAPMKISRNAVTFGKGASKRTLSKADKAGIIAALSGAYAITSADKNTLQKKAKSWWKMDQKSFEKEIGWDKKKEYTEAAYKKMKKNYTFGGEIKSVSIDFEGGPEKAIKKLRSQSGKNPDELRAYFQTEAGKSALTALWDTLGKWKEHPKARKYMKDWVGEVKWDSKDHFLDTFTFPTKKSHTKVVKD